MDKLTAFDLAELKNKKILITGASGFIGSNLSRLLCDVGAQVYGTSRIDRVSNRDNFTWLKCSLDDFDVANELLSRIRPDIIYHLSGEVTGSTDIKHIQGTFKSLVTSTVNLLTLATNKGCERIILMGSCREPVEKVQSPNSPYSMAKWAASAYGNLFWECYQTPVVIIRTFVTYGPGQPSNMLIPYVIQSLLKNESPKLSSGKWATDWIYIDDVIEGMIAASLVPNIEGTTVDLGTGILTSVKEVVEKIDTTIGSEATPLFGALPDRNNEHVRLADTEFAFDKLRWKANTTLEKGLTKTIEAIKSSILMRVYISSHSLLEMIISDGLYM